MSLRAIAQTTRQADACDRNLHSTGSLATAR